jgi:hypothetical protein
MLVLGIAVVFLLTSPTWFATGQDGVAVAQIVLGFVLVGVGVWLYRASATGATRGGGRCDGG